MPYLAGWQGLPHPIPCIFNHRQITPSELHPLRGFRACFFLSFPRGWFNFSPRTSLNNGSFLRQLLDLPGGFTKITVSCLDGDIGSVMCSVLRCPGTLEYLTIQYCRLSHPSFNSRDWSLSCSPLPQTQARTRQLRLTSPQPQNQKTWCFGGHN